MNDQEAHDLLITIAANQEAHQAENHRRLTKIEEKLEKRMCHTHAEKIHTLEKLVWGAVGTAIAAAIKSFWPSGS